MLFAFSIFTNGSMLLVIDYFGRPLYDLKARQCILAIIKAILG